MKEASIVLFWWLLFGGTHILLSSSSVRPKLIAQLGNRPFLGVYSLVAFATFIPLVVFYARHKHAGPQLWHIMPPYLVARDLNLALMAFAFILLVTGLVSRPPSSLMTSGVPEAYGVTRITRHPTFAAIFLFGIAHCLVNGHLSDLIFFGGFSLFAWIGAAHQDSRKVVEIPGYAEFKNETSFMPFRAMFSGRQQLDLRELRWSIVLVAFVVFYIVRAHHPQLFGGVLMTL
ncbi:MAG: NnrU family protein [Candidatus Binatia bacterium]